MFDRFTPEARRAVAVARTEARTLEHAAVEPVHLLLSLLGMPGSPLAALFGDTVTLEAGRRLARSGLPAADPVIEKPPFSASLKVLLVQLDHGRGAGADGVVAPAHLVSALLDADDALVVDVIRTARREAAAAEVPPASPATVEEAPPLVARRPSAAVPAPVREPATETEPGPAPEPEPEPEQVAAPEPEPEPEPESEPVEAVAPPVEIEPAASEQRPLPPERAVEPVASTAAPRSEPPPASESLRALAATLARSTAVAVAVGLVVYRRTSRGARRKADRAGRAARVVVR